jgi:osmoprotectant transport system permease protein
MLNVVMIACVLVSPVRASEAPEINIGSKRFTESYILGEIFVASVSRAGAVKGTHKPGLGNTGILFAALRSGAIDLYPEYTGTIAHELLRDPSLADLESLNRALAHHGLIAFAPLGFNNTYALAVREALAEERGLTRISDLAKHPELRFGLSQEFINRQDGWAKLRSAYGFTANPRGLDHGLAYEALDGRQVDVIDIYSTDAKQVRYRLRVLEDDRQVFPQYQAVILARADLKLRAPEAWATLEQLAGTLNAKTMTALNARAELDGQSFRSIAERHLGLASTDSDTSADQRGNRVLAALLAPDLGKLTAEHLFLVGMSLAAAILIGIPLGVLAERKVGVRKLILALVAVIQTIPALALLAFLIPVMGAIGTRPALAALFFYSLLPIVRNTLSGLQDIPHSLRESALSLGFSARARLVLIELPLAMRSILAGIKTSAVLNVGTATIAAFIGAGGYGERIASGLALNDNALLLAGAIPAAAMALAVQWGFDLMERQCVSPGLQVGAKGRATG